MEIPKTTRDGNGCPKEGGRLAWNEEVEAERNVLRLFPPRKENHPNEKPIRLVEIFINNHTLPHDTVLDPFMGSGTTGVACVNLGRKFIGIEIDPDYFEIACRRIREAYQQPWLFEDQPQPKQGELDGLGGKP